MSLPQVFTDIPDEPELAAATLMVDLKALQQNWRKIALEVSPAECAATVKGDAYGLGIEPCAKALWQAGARTFFVALPVEGATLRQILPDATIYILDGLFQGTAAFYNQHDLIPCLNSLEEIAEWARFSRTVKPLPACAIHIDSGINRLGLTRTEVEKLATESGSLDHCNVTLILSHLASGDDPGNEMNREQLEMFSRLRKLLPDAPASLANSPGSFLGRDFALDMARPGVALYGGNPFAKRSNPMSPVARLYAPILQVRDIDAGETVGYGATWRAERASRIAIIGVGYRDGYLRSLSFPANDGPAQVMIGGQFAPVVGRVSMDMITVDVTGIAPEFARRGGKAELMGDHVTVDDLGSWAGTIPYEILTSLGSRYARLYSPLESL